MIDINDVKTMPKAERESALLEERARGYSYALKEVDIR